MKIPYNVLFREYLGGEEENVLGFKEAGDVLVEFVTAGEKYSWHEAFFRPVLLLYRHYLELELKYWTIMLKGKLRKREHSLKELWSGLRPLIEPFCRSKGDQNLLAQVERVVLEFHQYDPSGQESRYTRTTKDTPTLTQVPKRIDVKNLKNKVGEACGFFTGLAEVAIQDE